MTTEHAARQINAWEVAQHQFDLAADRLQLDPGLRRVLRETRRELTVHFPVKLAAAERRSWPRPTADMPDDETLEAMSRDGEMEATDGCGGIEDDGFCEHGHPSWMLELGMI